MGKRIITQRRGRGTLTYIAHSFRFKGKISLRKLDETETTSAIYGRVIDLMHCPGHSAPLAKIRYDNGEEILISAPLGIKVNDAVSSGTASNISIGNVLPLRKIPAGTEIYNIETKPGDGGRLVRCSGTTAIVITQADENVVVRLPSKKEKTLNGNCRAVGGMAAGGGRKDKPFIKAGKRWHAMHARGKLYPQTSGVAMNAVDHPFGSGRGRHIGKSKVAPRHAPPGRNVGTIRSRRTGVKK